MKSVAIRFIFAASEGVGMQRGIFDVTLAGTKLSLGTLPAEAARLKLPALADACARCILQ